MTPRRALTLVELLVVLTILTTLSVVALEATEGKLNQTRYETGRRLIDRVQHAVVGDPGLREPDGTLLIQGFVADMGRLPLAGGDLDGAELWAGGAPAYGLVSSSLDPEVQLGVGWRGPYLRLPLDADAIRDGWGQPLELWSSGSGVTAATDAIDEVWCRGRDGAVGGTGYAQDLGVALATDAQFRVRLEASDGTPPDPADDSPPRPYLYVVYFAPLVSGGVASVQAVVKTAAADGVTFPELAFVAADGVTVGPRAVRAYQSDQATLADALDPANAATLNRSRVLYLSLPTGGLSAAKDLVLR